MIVNNKLCGVSRSKMGPETIGKFVSSVKYTGDDERFKGKTFEFNQCCGMCLGSFPKMWETKADEILAYHGLVSQQGSTTGKEKPAEETESQDKPD